MREHDETIILYHCETCDYVSEDKTEWQEDYTGAYYCPLCSQELSQCDRCEEYTPELINGLCEPCKGDLS